MADHTPGPWVIREHILGYEKRRAWIEINAPMDNGMGEHPICRIFSGFTNQDADARLIAAAPDLLVACQAMALAGNENPCNILTEMCNAVKLAEVAIAKATGK